MTDSFLSTDDIAKEMYRTSILAHFAGPGEAAKAQAVKGAEVTYAGSPLTVTFKMPNGTSESWQEIHRTDNPETGFKAMAFKRVGPAVPVPAPVRLEFPGFTGVKEELETIRKFSAGEDISKLLSEAEQFAAEVKEKIGGTETAITIGAHSIGSTAAMAAAGKLRRLGMSTKTLLVEPCAAAFGLYQLAQRIHNEPVANGKKSPSVDEVLAEMARNTHSIRMGVGTLFGSIKIGDRASNNKEFGHVYHLNPQTEGPSRHKVFGRLREHLVDHHRLATLARELLNKTAFTGEPTLVIPCAEWFQKPLTAAQSWGVFAQTLAVRVMQVFPDNLLPTRSKKFARGSLPTADSR